MNDKISRTDDASLAGLLRFETTSRLGRLFSPRIRKPASPFLHVGCGDQILAGFDNIDFYALRFWRSPHIGHDLRFPLPYRDESFDGAFSEHTLEHLPLPVATALLADIRRVLKPGAVFRVSVPDVGKYIDFYNGKMPDAAFGQFASGCEAIGSLTQNWGHVSCWDAETLVHRLQAAGFRSAAPAGFRQGLNSQLLRDQPGRAWELVYVEAIA